MADDNTVAYATETQKNSVETYKKFYTRWGRVSKWIGMAIIVIYIFGLCYNIW